MGLFWLKWLQERLNQVPLTTEKTGSGPWLKSGWDHFFLTVYTGNNKVRLMIEQCNSTHARNHRKARQAHMKKMVRNEDAFTQRFRTAKWVRTRFFPVLEPLPPMAPKPEKSESGSISWKHGKEGLHGKNIWSVPTFFMVPDPFFSVNGALDFGLQGWIGTLGLEQVF